MDMVPKNTPFHRTHIYAYSEYKLELVNKERTNDWKKGDTEDMRKGIIVINGFSHEIITFHWLEEKTFIYMYHCIFEYYIIRAII